MLCTAKPRDMFLWREGKVRVRKAGGRMCNICCRIDRKQDRISENGMRNGTTLTLSNLP